MNYAFFYTQSFESQIAQIAQKSIYEQKVMETILNYHIQLSSATAQKMKFSIKDFFSKCYQICSFLRIWSHLLKISLMENFIFCRECRRLKD